MILYSTLHYFNETTQINNKILESGEDFTLYSSDIVHKKMYNISLNLLFKFFS